jgi:hypothetical protein
LTDHLISRYYFPISRTTPVSVTDILDLVKPVGMLKAANSSAHDITHDDIWLALLLMKEVNVADGKHWEKLALL